MEQMVVGRTLVVATTSVSATLASVVRRSSCSLVGGVRGLLVLRSASRSLASRSVFLGSRVVGSPGALRVVNEDLSGQELGERIACFV